MMATASVAKAPAAPASVGEDAQEEPAHYNDEDDQCLNGAREGTLPALSRYSSAFGPISGPERGPDENDCHEEQVSRTPGRMPARKSSPMDCSVRIPYTMKITLGGIRMPRLPRGNHAGGQLGLVVVPLHLGQVAAAMVAAVALVEPQMAEKAAQALTVAMASPPGYGR